MNLPVHDDIINLIEEAQITVTGIVQGVGFRPFIYRRAVENELKGFVKNRGDAVVEILVQGEKRTITFFLEELRTKKPPQARIDMIQVHWRKPIFIAGGFEILNSDTTALLSGSVIPPDISICNQCIDELNDATNRRRNYFFITCVDCGPRFTAIEHLPYDRPNTVMKDFPMCNFCKREYNNQSNRRFHAQTIACPDCGPRVYLKDRNGELEESSDPIREAGRLLCEGYILAIKGYGGFHVATSTTMSEPVDRLRRIKHRSEKPFAIMARSLEVIKRFAYVNETEQELLTSPAKPIVILKMKERDFLSPAISPGLHTVGVMLPYTGLHLMLFDGVDEPAFVMTSANPPGEPIVKDDETALRELGDTVDYFLFHNRPILNRCDDSVIRVNDGDTAFIRRSRGYAPAPIRLAQAAKNEVLGMGAEWNVSPCILSKEKAFFTQHIGDMGRLETYLFLLDAVEHLLCLTNTKFGATASDLHPTMVTTRLAEELSEKYHIPVIKVQHHHAHAAALMQEYGVDELITVDCDGIGYGPDGTAWGGEVLYSDRANFERLAHLETHPMVGGDLASIYPLRMAAGILYPENDVSSFLYSRLPCFPRGKQEIELLLNQLSKGVKHMTSSCGRVLDAVSSIIGLCYERTYEGEPAMKLESLATGGVDVLSLRPRINGNIVETKSVVTEIYAMLDKHRPADLAYSLEEYLARSLGEIAVQEASRLKLKHIGFTGGVAYNEHIGGSLRRQVEDEGFKFLFHRQVPPGDGGISFGQAVAADALLG